MPDRSQAKHHLSGAEVFWLALRTGLLTVATLGIYRFWAKTKIRQMFWAGTELDGDRFEYTGTGLEKFKGFLIAVVFLAVYLGLLQMGLLFLGLSVLREPATEREAVAQFVGFNLIFLAVLPFILFATYRARRYQMSRTRWRGIRFGMDSAAWGYVWRALGHGALTVLTLGLLWPRMTFHLEKYMTDRMYFGDARFAQGGRWQDLYGAMQRLLVGSGLLVGAVVIGVALERPGLATLTGIAGVIWFAVGLVHYRVQSFAYLTSHKVLNGGITLVAAPRTGTVIYTYIVGGIVAGLVTGVLLTVLAGISAVMMGVFTGYAAQSPMPGLGDIVLVALGYLASLALGAAVAMALITRPIIAHYTDTLSVRNVDALHAIRQRAHDAGADAEGFADALDVGGAL